MITKQYFSKIVTVSHCNSIKTLIQKHKGIKNSGYYVKKQIETTKISQRGIQSQLINI